MPIRPENKGIYPEDSAEIRRETMEGRRKEAARSAWARSLFNDDPMRAWIDKRRRERRLAKLTEQGARVVSEPDGQTSLF